MKRYRFPLERLLAIRRMEADLARAALERQMAEVRRHEEFRREIARQTHEASQAGLRSGATGMELAGAANFRGYARQADTMVAAEQRKAVAAAEAKRRATVAAEQRVKALETLDERSRERWQKQLDREIEQFASEAFLARWGAGH